MRILHTIPGRNWGGMEHRTLEQVRWLVAHGHDVWLAAPPDGEGFAHAQAMALPVVPMVFDCPWRPATVSALRRLVRDNRVEVIDTHVTRDAKAAMFCLDLCAVVRSRHVNQPLTASPLRRLQWRLGNDHIITVADVTRRALVATGLADSRRATAIGGWADESFFAPPDPATRRAVRAELGLEDGVPVLLCVGMLRPDKGQDHLIRALGLLAARGCRPVCLLAGAATAEGADYVAGLGALLAGAGVADRVRFLGYRDDVADLLQAADVVVIPSLTEAQPRVAVQAFAAGRPVVATAVGGIPEIVKSGVTGWLVPAMDAESLAGAIASVLADSAGAAAIAANARSLAEQTMRFDQRMEQTLAVYRLATAHACARVAPRLRGIRR